MGIASETHAKVAQCRGIVLKMDERASFIVSRIHGHEV
jgi:hypothetical protein